MLQAIEELLVLQNRDQKIRDLRTGLTMIPLERAGLESRLANLSSQFEQAKLHSKEIEVEKKNLEISAQAKRDSIGKFKAQQFQTRKNEEFQALSNEIKRYDNDIQTIEDRELELMEEAEKAKVIVAAAEQEYRAAKSQVDAQLTDLIERAAALEKSIAELEEERAKLSAAVDEDLLFRYDRLFKSKGDAAVVPLEHEVCMGCHMKLTTQTSVRVRGGRDIVNCEQCGRLLYWSDLVI
jgi:predicted  nucleic acid-binding Zn-ribbon protein